MENIEGRVTSQGATVIEHVTVTLSGVRAHGNKIAEWWGSFSAPYGVLKMESYRLDGTDGRSGTFSVTRLDPGDDGQVEVIFRGDSPFV